MKLSYFFLAFSWPLFGTQHFDDAAAASQETNIDVPHKSSLRAVVIASRADFLIKDRTEIEQLEGVVLRGVELPGSRSDLEARVFDSNLDERPDSETLREIIIQFYIENNRPFILVEFYNEADSSHVAQFVVEESRLGKVRVEGARWSSPARLERYLKVKPGDPINSAQIVKNLGFINRNPFRTVDLIYGAGDGPRTTDIDLVVDDGSMFSVYAGTDNTGINSIGQGRFFAGMNWADAFKQDHIFSAQYTASYDFYKFQAATAQYTIPFPWNQLLTLYGGYSRAHVKLSAPGMHNHAMSAQGSLRYIIPLLPIAMINHEIDAGFDFKQMNNTVFFAEVFPVYSKVVNLTQLTFGYSLEAKSQVSSHRFRAQMFCSPGGFLSHQSDQDYSTLRAGAVNHWVYFNAMWRYVRSLPRACSLHVISQAQWSSSTLLPSEEMGMGGYDTVRGYKERQYNADTGLLLTIEGRGPQKSLFLRSGKTRDAIQWLLFADLGLGMDRTAVPTQSKNAYLAGVGPGVRYAIGSYLNARLDWGIKLHKKPSLGTGSSMFHFSFIASY